MSFGREEAEARRLQSPCTGVCLIDEQTGFCQGCLRTLDEVAAWGSSTVSQRLEILAAIKRRREPLGFTAPPER